jgi:D-alanine--poly(phosphoribitol) ligase subunit 1
MSKYFYNLGLFFEYIARKYRSNFAIAYKHKAYSYAEVNRKADRLVHFLVQKNIGQGDVIAIANTKNINSFALMLACLKIGVIYANIDIEGPAERLEKIFKTCEPKIVFSDENSDLIKETSMRMSISSFLLSDELVRNINDSEVSIQELVRSIDGSSIAYIMFTSGSTGVPKGAAITHQNLIHLIKWSHSFYNIRDYDVFANVSPLYFDNSVFDFYSALFSGSCLVPIKKDVLTNPLLLVNYVDDVKCTIWFSVPSMLIYLMNMKGLNKDKLEYLRIIAFGGEGYPKTELVKLYEMFKERAEIVNVYGPTECTCICSAYRLQDNDFNDLKGLPTLGHLNQNFSYLILDEEGNETSEGELYLIGPNVGVGYYKDSERSDQVFMDCAKGKFYTKRMYRTGDIVKEENGMLYFKARKDNQIKHMGYRIELEEIEAGINLIEGVERSAVIYKKENVTFGKIIAFVSVKEGLNKETIEAELKERIPLYMVPNIINILDALPVNPNGKIDKKVLAGLENGINSQ